MNKIIGIHANESICYVTCMEGGKIVTIGSFTPYFESKFFANSGYNKDTFTKAKDLASKHLGETVSQVVVAIPSIVGSQYKWDLIKDASSAGLEIIRMVKYSDCLSLAYGFGIKVSETVNAYTVDDFDVDFGISTIDDGVCETKAVTGEHTSIKNDHDIIDMLNGAFKDSGVGVVKNSKFIVAGKLSNDLRKNLSQYFQIVDAAPDMIAQGAAIQAAVLSGDSAVNDIMLLSVIPQSVGIEAPDGGVYTILPKNTTIPTKKTARFALTSPNQDTAVINVLYGNSSKELENETVGYLKLTGLTSNSEIEITTDVDANAVLHVTAKDKSKGNEASCKMKL